MRSVTSADLQLDLVRRADVEQATICKVVVLAVRSFANE